MATQRRSIATLLDSLIDKDGLQAEVTLTLTDEMLLKAIGALVASGIAIVVVAGVVKNMFPTIQLSAIHRELTEIKQKL